MPSFDRDDTYKKVVAIIAHELKVEGNTVTESASFSDLGADSLDLFEITLKLEEKFGLEINDKDAEQIKSVKAAVDYIQQKRTK